MKIGENLDGIERMKFSFKIKPPGMNFPKIFHKFATERGKFYISVVSTIRFVILQHKVYKIESSMNFAVIFRKFSIFLPIFSGGLWDFLPFSLVMLHAIS